MPPVQKNSNKGLLIAAVVILGALLACAVVYLVLNSGDEAKDDKKEAVIEEISVRYPADMTHQDKRFHDFDWLIDGKIGSADLSGLSAGDLRLLRNAIFAVHGYRFKDKDLLDYFSRFEWYSPEYSDVSGRLTGVEAANVAFIQKYEGKGNGASAGKSGNRFKGQVTFADDYSDIVCYIPLTDADVQGLSKAELRILRNTIYARHGRRFKSVDLQNYFNGMPWYNPVKDEVAPGELSQTELHNIKLIQAYE